MLAYNMGKKQTYDAVLRTVLIIACVGAIYQSLPPTHSEGFISPSELKPIKAAKRLNKSVKKSASKTVETFMGHVREQVRGGARLIRLID